MSTNQDLYRSHLNDPDFRGEKTKPHLSNGPLEERTCTDLFCYLLFIACWVGSVFVALYSFSKGNPQEAFYPADSSGNTCGLASGFESYPYLYFADVDDLNHTVCVKTCPDWEEDEQSPDNIDCKPNDQVRDCKLSQVDIYRTFEFAAVVCMPQVDNSTLFRHIQSYINIPDWDQGIEDVATSKWMLIGAPMIALFLSFVWVLLLWYCAGAMTWGLIIFYFLTLAVGGLWMFELANNPDKFDFGVKSLRNVSSTTFKVIAYAAWGVGGLSIVLLLCWFRKISLAVAVLKCASQFVETLPQIIGVPPIFFLVTIAYAAYWAAVSVYLWSAGTIQYNTQGYPFKTVEHTSTQNLFIGVHLLHGYWNFFFLMAVPQFIISSSCCYWYFCGGESGTMRSPILKSFWRGIILHGGSLAFGSAVLAVVALIKLFMDYIHERLKTITGGEGPNGCVRCLVSCISCCLDCFERFIRFLNRHAYVQIAMTGEGFCKAAEHAFYLGVRNAVRLGIVHGLGRVFTFFGELFITFATGFTAYILFLNIEYYKVSLFNPIVPSIFIAIIGYIIASNFLGVYGVAADTIIHVFCMDEEMHTYGPKHAPKLLRAFIDEHFGQRLLNE